MTAHHTPIAMLAKPLHGIYSSISRTTGRYIETKAQHARLTHLNKLLSELDPHILKDIGMEGFDRLTPAKKLQALVGRGPGVCRARGGVGQTKTTPALAGVGAGAISVAVAKCRPKRIAPKAAIPCVGEVSFFLQSRFTQALKPVLAVTVFAVEINRLTWRLTIRDRIWRIFRPYRISPPPGFRAGPCLPR